MDAFIKAVAGELAGQLLGKDVATRIAPQANDNFGATHKIVVCQRGFVYAGDVSQSGDYIVIDNAVNIRRWGTTRGLGELAANGVTVDTKADPCGTVRIHALAVVLMIDCTERINATA